MTTDLIIVGAGGFGREAIDVARASQRAGAIDVRLLGVVDDAPSEVNLARLERQGVGPLGGRDALVSRPDVRFAIGIGDPRVRASIARLLESAGLSAMTLVHPTAVIGTGSRMEDGVVICGGVQVSTDVTIGRHAHLNPNTTIGHDTVIDDFVSINPGAIVSGDVRVGARSLIGAGAVVLQGLTIGPDSVVGASACVVRDVLENSTVKGVPAR